MSTTQRLGHFDLAVVGAGILGLASALAGARRGLRVVVIDRDTFANGASVRNFGFVTVSGQQRGTMWQRARRSREVWREVTAAAAIPVLQRGAWMVARRAEAACVLEAFMATEMAAGCRLLDPAAARRHCPQLRMPGLVAVLESGIELRVESRDAIPRLSEWLATAHGVTFLRQTSVRAVELPQVGIPPAACNPCRARHRLCRGRFQQSVSGAIWRATSSRAASCRCCDCRLPGFVYLPCSCPI